MHRSLARPLNTNLHSGGSNDVKGSDQSRDEVNDFDEAVLTDAPGAVDDEHHVGFGASAN